MPARPYATPLDTFIHYAFTSHITTGIKYHSPSNSRLKFHSFTESWAHRYKYIVFVVRFNHFPVGHQQHFLRVLFLSLVRSVGRTRDWAVGSVECYSLQIFIRRSRFQLAGFPRHEKDGLLSGEWEKEMQRDWMGTRRWSGMMENHAFLVFSDSFFWVQVCNHFNFSPWFIVAAVVRGEPSKKKIHVGILALKSSHMGPSHLYIWSGRQ